MSKANGNPPLTDWYPADVKPVRVGWYQREYARDWLTDHCDWWDGRRWILCCTDGSRLGPSQDERRWRGLSAPAKEA